MTQGEALVTGKPGSEVRLRQDTRQVRLALLVVTILRVSEGRYCPRYLLSLRARRASNGRTS